MKRALSGAPFKPKKKSAILFIGQCRLSKMPSVHHSFAPALNIPQVHSSECSNRDKVQS